MIYSKETEPQITQRCIDGLPHKFNRLNIGTGWIPGVGPPPSLVEFYCEKCLKIVAFPVKYE